MAVTIGYIGATGRDIGYYGTAGGGDDRSLSTSTRSIRRWPARPSPVRTDVDAAALRANVPNPFFGVPGTGEFGSRPTIQAGQLLRPFRSSATSERRNDRRRTTPAHAATFVLEKRTTGWWGGRFSYTLSRSEDNQFGQASTFQTRTCTAAEQLRPRRRAWHRQQLRFAAPHHPGADREVPELRKGGVAGLLLDGWNGSAVVELVSGSPLNAVMSAGALESNLGLFGGRQRPNLVGDPNTDGSDTDRVVRGQRGRPAFRQRAFANPEWAPRQRPAYRRRRPVSVPQERRPGARQGHDDLRQPRRTGPVRDPESDQHGQVPRLLRQQQRRRLDRLRHDCRAGRVHADLAAQLPVYVRRGGIKAQGRRQNSCFCLLPTPFVFAAVSP